MADVTLESTEEIIQLVSVSGAQSSDISAAVAVEAAARAAADTAHNTSPTAHGLNANIFAGLTGAASPSAANVFATMADVGSGLQANIIAWQTINRQAVRYAGILPANWGLINNSLSTVTAISGVITERMMQDGYITAVQFYSYDVTGGIVKFKVFRPNGSNYDFVGQSENITVPTLIGPMAYQLVTPIACRPGDVFGFYSTAKLGIKAETVTTGVRYAAGDVSTTNAFATLLNDYHLAIAALGAIPYIAGTGDSILEGQTTWLSFYDVGPAGTIVHEPWYQMRLLAPDAFLPYQNHCDGAQTFAWVLSTGVVSALATGAKYIWIGAGVNDVQTGRTWAAVLSDLNAIKVLFDAANTTGSRQLMINEILPWTAGTDGNAATIRTFNTNLAAWCVTNNATLVVCHNAMGQIRGSTGQLDDLLTAYDADGVHLTQAGISALAALMFAYL